jgi:hypothetical protein
LKLSTNLTRIKALQDRVLNEPSRSERERHQAALNDLVEENKRLGRVLQKAGLAIKNHPKKFMKIIQTFLFETDFYGLIRHKLSFIYKKIVRYRYALN